MHGSVVAAVSLRYRILGLSSEVQGSAGYRVGNRISFQKYSGMVYVVPGKKVVIPKHS